MGSERQPSYLGKFMNGYNKIVTQIKSVTTTKAMGQVTSGYRPFIRLPTFIAVTRTHERPNTTDISTTANGQLIASSKCS